MSAYPSVARADAPGDGTTTSAVTFQGNDGWTYRVALDGNRVAGFLATHDPATVPEHTFATIWFQRQADDTFAWKGIAGTQSVESAVKTIEALMGNTQLFAQDAFFGATNDPETPFATFTPMTNGLDSSDIFQSIIPYLTANEVEFVVEVEAKGAIALTSAKVTPATECGVVSANDMVDSMLTQMRLTIENSLSLQTSNPTVPFENNPTTASSQVAASMCFNCPPLYWTTHGAYTPGGCAPEGTPTSDGYCTYGCSSCTYPHTRYQMLSNCLVIVFTYTTTAPCTKRAVQTAPGVCP